MLRSHFYMSNRVIDMINHSIDIATAYIFAARRRKTRISIEPKLNVAALQEILRNDLTRLDNQRDGQTNCF